MVKVKISFSSIQTDIEKEVALRRGEKIEEIVAALQEATPVDTGYARGNWVNNSNKTITNDAEYLEQLNAGSSQQAPSHFIESTLLNIKGVNSKGTVVLYK